MKNIVLMLTFLLVGSSFAKSMKNHKHINKKPIAKLKVSQKKCDSPCTVTLDGSKSIAEKGKTISKYIFDLGNGETIESTTPSIEFTYINFKEETDKIKRKKREDKYKKWEKYIHHCKKRFKNFDKFEIKLQVVQSDNKSSKKDKKNLLVKPSDLMPVIDGDDIIPAVPEPELDKVGLLGIDSDMDGVPDRLELLINEIYPNNSNVRVAAKDYVKKVFATYLLRTDKDLSIAASKITIKANHCLSFQEKAAGIPSSTAFQNFSAIRKSIANTEDRVRAKSKVSANFNGQVIALPAENSQVCPN